MQSAKGKAVIALAAMLVLSACASGSPRLMNLTSGEGPDEFGIVPPKPLALPENLSALPQPTPGGANLADPNPEADAILALGGKPSTSNGIPSGDSALFAHAARYGVDQGIRTTLAAEDLEWRRDNNGRVLERWFNVNVYYKAYRDQRLDQQAELLRWRALGVRTSSAPPRQDGEQ